MPTGRQLAGRWVAGPCALQLSFCKPSVREGPAVQQDLRGEQDARGGAEPPALLRCEVDFYDCERHGCRRVGSYPLQDRLRVVAQTALLLREQRDGHRGPSFRADALLVAVRRVGSG